KPIRRAKTLAKIHNDSIMPLLAEIGCAPTISRNVLRGAELHIKDIHQQVHWNILVANVGRDRRTKQGTDTVIQADRERKGSHTPRLKRTASIIVLLVEMQLEGQ